MTQTKSSTGTRYIALLLGAASLALSPLGMTGGAPSLFSSAGAAPGGNGNGANGGNGNSGNANGGNSGNAGAAASSRDAGTGASGSQGHGGPAPADHAALASALGALNASHASSTALNNAAPSSQVGKIAAYDRAMIAALSLPGTTPTQIAAQQKAIATARSTQLAQASNKPLTADVVAQVDRNLGLPAVDPTLGLR